MIFSPIKKSYYPTNRIKDTMTENQPPQLSDMDESRLDSHEGEYSPLREQDRFLPIANVTRIMKKVLPNGAKISKDAKECIQECVSEFVSFITGEYPFYDLSFL